MSLGMHTFLVSLSLANGLRQTTGRYLARLKSPTCTSSPRTQPVNSYNALNHTLQLESRRRF